MTEYTQWNAQNPQPATTPAPKRPVAAVLAAVLMVPTALGYLAIVIGLQWLVSAIGDGFAAATGKIELYIILAAIVIGLVYLAVMAGILLGRDLARVAAFTVSGVNLLCCGGLMTFSTGVIEPVNQLLTKLLGAADVGATISLVFIVLFVSQILTVVLLSLPNVARWFAHKAMR